MLSPAGQAERRTFTARTRVAVAPRLSLTKKVTLWVPGTSVLIPHFDTPFLANLNLTPSGLQASTYEVRSPSSASMAVAPRSHTSLSLENSVHMVYVSNCETSTSAGPLSRSTGAVFGGGGSSSSAMPWQSPPEVQEPSGQGSSSGAPGSLDAHGFTTTTRRRTTAAGLPALSATLYVMTCGAPAGVAAAVVTAATPKADTLSVRSPSSSSHADTPACAHVPCICTVSIMIRTPAGVTASWPSPFSVNTGGTVSVGGTYSTTAGAAGSVSCEIHRQLPSSVHTAHALVESTHRNEGGVHGLTTATILSTGSAAFPAASVAEYVMTYGEFGSVG
mmetsp:Transcript_12681/g.26764  ORF Transcript_12681/g.26764 Transcript_12681/m.26764 type:complete len:333 (+) Transcript_12681:1456-2454(+)